MALIKKVTKIDLFFFNKSFLIDIFHNKSVNELFIQYNNLYFSYINTDFNEYFIMKMISNMMVDSIVFNNKSLIIHLNKGLYQIFLNKEFSNKGVGFHSYEESYIKTKGFKWEINWKMNLFNYSSSNEFDESYLNKESNNDIRHLEIDVIEGSLYISFELI